MDLTGSLLVMPPAWLVETAIALLWLYEGVWCKLLGREPRQARAVGQAGATAATTRRLFLALGWVELGLALWVLSGFAPGLCALAQTVVVVTLTTGALAVARDVIHDPAGVVFKNIVFVTLIWVPPGLAGLSRAAGA